MAILFQNNLISIWKPHRGLCAILAKQSRGRRGKTETETATKKKLREKKLNRYFGHDSY